MKKFFLIFVAISFLIVGGCSKTMSKEDKEKIEQEASDTAVEYLKIKEDKDFVVKKTEFSSDKTSSIIFLYGYYKPEKNKEVVLMVDYADDYKITGVGNN
ncbi:hypothetical protein C1N87_32390 (plasmid) [Priestia aryabhattai]